MAKNRLLKAILQFLAISAFLSKPAFADDPVCTGSQASVASATAPVVKQLLDQAINALNNPSTDDRQRIQTWFGATSASDIQKIKQVYINSRGFVDGITFLCAVNSNASIGDVYAYVYPDNSFAITLAAFFFGASDNGAFDSKPGVIVHEMSHFVLAGATKDTIYGVGEAQDIALANPHKAQQTADNYEYFAEAIAFGLDAPHFRSLRNKWKQGNPRH